MDLEILSSGTLCDIVKVIDINRDWRTINTLCINKKEHHLKDCFSYHIVRSVNENVSLIYCINKSFIIGLESLGIF